MKIKKLALLITNIIWLLIAMTSLVNAGFTIKIVDIKNEPVANMVVYLVPLENQKLKNIKTERLEIFQKDKKFSPYISVIKKGLPLSFVNKDKITHQIYSASAANRFSFRLKRGAEKKINSMSATGEVLMGCNIHDWMSGYLLILDTPLYTKTNFNGESVFDINEGGRYRLVIWHPKLMEKNNNISREVMLGKDLHLRINLTKKMAAIPSQNNPEFFDFLEEY